MAIHNSTILIIIASFLILLHMPQNVKSVSFTFPSFGPYAKDLFFEGDAYASNGAIQLTNTVPNQAGRASFAAPVRLWDSKTGTLGGFTTNFSFVVAPTGPGLLADGIAFFVAPFSSTIPKNSSGGFLGLFNSDSALNAYKNQIVAVEFDSFYGNPWDPVSSHVGIDVNSIASVKTAPWQTGNYGNGYTAFGTVKYEPVAKILSVVVRYPGSNDVNGTTSSLSFVIDLRTVLPEWVRVGFSGATGQLVETHKILSWDFVSSSFY
ncbi:hypothetical protein RIF29_33181 [Crotalaria pallida]|uniref:Legume lectin domain-containing protein n=1 Tax=Crotalaria pallida TaxID=3830 RepID=A0AAN9E7V3_CROPI